MHVRAGRRRRRAAGEADADLSGGASESVGADGVVVDGEAVGRRGWRRPAAPARASSGHPMAAARSASAPGRGAGRRPGGPAPGGRCRRSVTAASLMPAEPSTGSGSGNPAAAQAQWLGAEGQASQRGLRLVQTAAPRSNTAWPHASVAGRDGGVGEGLRLPRRATGRPARARATNRPALVSTSPTSSLVGEHEHGPRRVRPDAGQGEQLVEGVGELAAVALDASVARRWRLTARRL